MEIMEAAKAQENDLRQLEMKEWFANKVANEIKHNLDEAKKWRDRGENYLQQAKYADDKNK